MYSGSGAGGWTGDTRDFKLLQRGSLRLLSEEVDEGRIGCGLGVWQPQRVTGMPHRRGMPFGSFTMGVHGGTGFQTSTYCYVSRRCQRPIPVYALYDEEIGMDDQQPRLPYLTWEEEEEASPRRMKHASVVAFYPITPFPVALSGVRSVDDVSPSLDTGRDSPGDDKSLDKLHSREVTRSQERSDELWSFGSENLDG